MNISGKAVAFILILITAVPAKAAMITGTVSGPDGSSGIAGIEVTAWIREGDIWHAYLPSVTDAAGQYTIDGDNFYEIDLPQGVYRIEFYDPYGFYAMESYNNALSFWQADEIVISNGSQVVAGIDASLAVGSSISGRVTAPDGFTPLANIEVTASVWDGSQWYWLNWIETDGNGNYTIEGLPVGSYLIDFYDSAGGYASETYDDFIVPGQGTEIVISAAGQAVNGINASLSDASVISGIITGPDGQTPLENIEADAWFWDGSEWVWMAWGSSDQTGAYSIGGLPAGQYRIEFYDSSGLYAIESYDDAMFWNATELVVVSGTAISGVDASLDYAARISGTVTGPDGTTPLEYAEVAAHIWSGTEWFFMNWAETDSNGDYDIGGLPPGTYQVDVYYYDEAYAYEVFNNAGALGLGSNIVLSAEQVIGNIDVSMNHVPPVVVGFYRAGTEAYNIDFTGIAGEHYTLQESGSLLSGWYDAGSPVICEPGTNRISISNTAGQAFWRIMELP